MPQLAQLEGLLKKHLLQDQSVSDKITQLCEWAKFIHAPQMLTSAKGNQCAFVLTIIF